MYLYKKSFILKDLKQRKIVDFRIYTNALNSAVVIYNSICAKTPNKKHISVTIYHNRLDFDIQSHKQLNLKYVGVALRLFSQILVQNYSFLPFCTNTNPRKLFITI